MNPNNVCKILWLKYDKKALALDPGNANLLKNVGLSYFFMKDYKNAVKFLEEVVSKDPNEKDSVEFLKRAKELL